MTLSFPQMAEAARALGAPLYADLPGDIAVSFEFFPPKSETMERTLWESVETLTPLRPSFVSVTYGAGGTTRERTHATVARIARDTPLKPAAHLTCVDASRDEIDAVARDYWAAGVRHIVALRGDPPRAGEKFAAHPDGYASAADLVAGLKRVADFELSVSAYPELLFGAQPRKPASQHEIGQALDLLSVSELRERIGLLRAELARVEAHAAAKEASRLAANAFFKP